MMRKVGRSMWFLLRLLPTRTSRDGGRVLRYKRWRGRIFIVGEEGR